MWHEIGREIEMGEQWKNTTGLAIKIGKNSYR